MSQQERVRVGIQSRNICISLRQSKRFQSKRTTKNRDLTSCVEAEAAEAAYQARRGGKAAERSTEFLRVHDHVPKTSPHHAPWNRDVLTGTSPGEGVTLLSEVCW